MSTKNEKKKVGRPFRYDWSKANLLWKTKTDTEISKVIGCTPANVHMRRKRLMEEHGRKKYGCRRKWQRETASH